MIFMLLDDSLTAQDYAQGNHLWFPYEVDGYYGEYWVWHDGSSSQYADWENQQLWVPTAVRK